MMPSESLILLAAGRGCNSSAGPVQPGRSDSEEHPWPAAEPGLSDPEWPLGPAATAGRSDPEQPERPEEQAPHELPAQHRPGHQQQGNMPPQVWHDLEHPEDHCTIV